MPAPTGCCHRELFSIRLFLYLKQQGLPNAQVHSTTTTVPKPLHCSPVALLLISPYLFPLDRIVDFMYSVQTLGRPDSYFGKTISDRRAT